MSDTPKPLTNSPWHAGEIAMQRRTGVADGMLELGRRVIRDFMPEQHREFFSQLEFILVGTVDHQNDVWATARSGRAGFVQSPDNRRLVVQALRETTDPATPGLTVGKSIGLLGIDLHTRRRNRMNGFVARRDDSAFEVEVDQSFGNCPSYIQRRVVEIVRDPRTPMASPPIRLQPTDTRVRQIIGDADTFFVATFADLAGRRQVDVSHRGGKPGFVRIEADGTLKIPDFAGNSFFNTLGNILLNGKAGLSFIDFSAGDVLQLSGDAEVIFDLPATLALNGAERLWQFVPQHLIFRASALPLRWTNTLDFLSPACAATGHWDTSRNPAIS